jgi:hypothetical protein
MRVNEDAQLVFARSNGLELIGGLKNKPLTRVFRPSALMTR